MQKKDSSVHTTNAAKHRTQVMNTLYCTLAPKAAPDAVVLGLVVLCELEVLLLDPLELEEDDDDGGAAAARLLTVAHVAAMFVLVLPSR